MRRQGRWFLFAVLLALASCAKSNGVEKPEEIGRALSAALQTADANQIPKLFWSSRPERLEGIAAFGKLLSELRELSAVSEAKFGSSAATARASLSDNVSETATPVKFTVEGDGVVSHVLFYQS